MEVFLIYLLKASGVLFLFGLTYILFLKRETYFVKNRWFLLTGLIASILLPLVTIKREVTIAFDTLNGLQAGDDSFKVITTNDLFSLLNWNSLLLFIYTLGVLFFLTRLVLQFNAIRTRIKGGKILKRDAFIHVETDEELSPFSFFNYIFYHPSQFGKNELEAIIAHEEGHAKQLHSIDILFLELVLIFQWFNPFIWVYKNLLKQNLEYLADSEACQNTLCKKSYQYVMLKQAIGTVKLPIANPFYNSLIKNRIVMLNQNQSQKMNTLKLLLIIPLLALFLMAFNTSKVYTFKSNSSIVVNEGKSIEILIGKNTTNEELEEIKADLAKDDIDFSYTVVHNENDEITDISLNVSGIGENGGKFSNSFKSSDNDSGISPLVILIDPKNNLVSIGGKGSAGSGVTKIHTARKNVWISSGNDDHTEVIIKKEDGSNKFYLNGIEIDEDEIHEHDLDIHFDEDPDEEGVHVIVNSDGDKKRVLRKKIRLKNSKSDKKDGHVFIMKDSDDHEDIEVIGEDGGFFFIDTNGKEKPLFIVDGKEASEKQVKKLLPKDVETVNVYKGKKSIAKYGKKAKNGVVEITTKNKK